MSEKLEELKELLASAKAKIESHKWDVDNQDIPDLTEVQSVVSSIEDAAQSLPTIEDVQRLDVYELEEALSSIQEAMDKLDNNWEDRNAFSEFYDDGPALINREMAHHISTMVRNFNKLIKAGCFQRFDADSWQKLWRVMSSLCKETEATVDKIVAEIDTYGQPLSKRTAIGLYKEE